MPITLSNTCLTSSTIYYFKLIFEFFKIFSQPKAKCLVHQVSMKIFVFDTIYIYF